VNSLRKCVHILALFLLAPAPLCAAAPAELPQPLSPALQAAVGNWQVIDDDGKPGGHVQTYLVDGQLFGKVTQSRPGRPPNELCTKCPGELRNQPVVGMVIIRNFHPEGDQWVGGTVLDPKNGKIYHGKIWMLSPDKLRMRGFVGISLFGRTETWTRLP
jgi:uncharacterized protein (DUF2147 family)